jgi:hypothetical protein
MFVAQKRCICDGSEGVNLEKCGYEAENRNAKP